MLLMSRCATVLSSTRLLSSATVLPGAGRQFDAAVLFTVYSRLLLWCHHPRAHPSQFCLAIKHCLELNYMPQYTCCWAEQS